jgi:putative acetyltransferase
MTSPEMRPASVEEVVNSGLIAELDADLLARYPGEPVNGIDPVEFQNAGGYFIMACQAGKPIGCGAFRPLDPATVEIKRMYVQPASRGQGIARKILHLLEAEARRRQYVRSILETAFRMPEAIALYRACGYEQIPLFAPYIGSQRSICFGKDL